jgi:hypothetical protein
VYCPTCGTQNSDRNRFCSNCGGSIVGQAPTVVGLPQQPVVSAPVMSAPPAASLRRAGNLLVATAGAQFPPYCVKCGAPAQKWVNKNFGWHTPWLYLIILVNVLIYAIVATIVMKRMRLNVPLCAQHYGRRRGWLTAGWIMLAGFLPISITIGMMGNGSDEAVGAAVLLGAAMFIASLVCLVIGSILLRPQEITDTQAIFTGVSPAFLQYVPDQPVSVTALGATQLR